jgi:uncharacterized protein (DUF2235 family)
MPRNILIFADGTGNEGGLLPDESRTNVYKLYRATRVDTDSAINPAEQLAFYIPGIGTPIPGRSSRWQRTKETVQQMVGGGLTKKIAECYAAVISSWQPGDRIYLFGFSRGAYTARCLAHVLELLGIPAKEPDGSALSFEPKSLHALALRGVKIVYRLGLPAKDVAERNKEAEKFRNAHGCHTAADIGALPYFVGVWDSVAAIGLARLIPATYDLHFPHEIKFARHAMAIDEYRRDFARVPWGGSKTVPQGQLDGVDRFQQVWFAGNHADIGGSYPETEARLSDIALEWMANCIEHELPESARVKIDRARLHCFPSPDGMMHDECMVGMGGTKFRWSQADRQVPADATLHESVYQRLELESVRNFVGYGKYRPAALRNHSKAKLYFTDLLPHQVAGQSSPIGAP